MDMMNLVKVLPKLLSKEECITLIDEFEKRKINATHESSLDTYGEYLKSTFKVIEIKETNKQYNFLLSKINYCLSEWIKHLESYNSFHIPIIKHALRFPHKIRLLRYNIGESIHDHVDWTPFRHASVTINLNEDYEGGEFQFFHNKQIMNLKQGDAIVFPADAFWVHGVTPVTKGKRYSVNTFIESYPEEMIMEILQTYKYFDDNRERKLKPE